jgi:putative PIN family toxin of toxin-antitoxin system
MIRIVVDTNVLVSALLKEYSSSALIVSLILQETLKLCLSPEILDEYKRVLSYNKFQDLDQTTVKALLAELLRKSLMVEPKTLLDIIKADSEDNKFLECALEAEADFFITGNIKHFSFKEFHQTKIVTPSQFLQIIAQTLIEE